MSEILFFAIPSGAEAPFHAWSLTDGLKPVPFKAYPRAGRISLKRLD